MRNRLLIGVVLCAAAWLSFYRPAEAQGQAPVGQYIVVLHDAVPNVPAVANEHAQQHAANVRFVYAAAMKGYAASIPNARLNAIRQDPRVAFISEDRPVAMFEDSIPTGVDRIDAELGYAMEINPSILNGLEVAVIDTGSGPHADLNVVDGYNCSSGPSYNDGNGHGSHVAGTIAGRPNLLGVIGVAPGAAINSVRVLNNAGSGSWSSVACGIDWVTNRRLEYNDGAFDGDAGRNIVVANMSLGGSGADDGNCGNLNNDALHKAICGSVAAGVTYVVAAGNNSANLSGFVPAAYNEVLTVTAIADFNGQPGGGAAATCRTDVDETPADFSNFTTADNAADVAHTIAAPGVCITSTWKGGAYKTISGTSMASPHVAGAVAICIASSLCPTADPEAGVGVAQIISRIRQDAAAQPAGKAGYGFVGDPSNALISGKGASQKTLYYGYLVFAGAY